MPAPDSFKVAASLASLLEEQQSRLCSVLDDWRTQQQRLQETQAAEQGRMIEALLGVHRGTLHELHTFTLPAPRESHRTRPESPPSSRPASAASSRSRPRSAPARSRPIANNRSRFKFWRVDDQLPDAGVQDLQAASEAPPATLIGVIPEQAEADETQEVKVVVIDEQELAKVAAAAQFQPSAPAGDESDGCKSTGIQEKQALLATWKRCHGLDTVDAWKLEGAVHGWGALLLIHGIPEVTQRLRVKVGSYAMYASFLLSMSMSLLASPIVAAPCEFDDWSSEWRECMIRKRVYGFSFWIGTVAHMLTILLATGFTNALNEAARDSDVFRMFTDGRGFHATLMCQLAFRFGCVADIVGVMAGSTMYLSLGEVVAFVVILTVLAGVVYHRNVHLLFRTASIVGYWRNSEGKASGLLSDPYDLHFPLECFREQVKTHQALFQRSEEREWKRAS